MEEKLIILTGNPNTGKTTIFNALTGLHQKTGNWPGVTVEIKEGYFIYEGVKFKVIDLPGTYSLTSFTEDEKIARDILVREKADAVVVILDASNIERNLYLVTLLLELEQKVIVDLNMYDIARDKGLVIDVNHMEKLLGTKCVITIGNKKTGIETLKKTIYEVSGQERQPTIKARYGQEVEEIISKVESIIKDLASPYPSRFFALRLLENDETMWSHIKDGNLYKEVKQLIEMTYNRIPDIETQLIEKRYGFIHGLIEECTRRIEIMEDKIELTNKLDRLFTHPFYGTIFFLFFIWLTFNIVFNWGSPFTNLLEGLFSFTATNLSRVLSSMNFPEWITSFLTNGIIGGVGSVLVFLPNIFLLFFIFAALEDSGYIARAAFVTDRLMHKIGLHGKSAIPMILGFGCNVPAIMATRTLETKKDRVLTTLSIPFMSCSARLPVYLLFTGIFFQNHRGSILFSLYLTGIFFGLITAKLFKRIFFKEETPPIIMELPLYHTPDIRNMLISAWERSYLFIRKAGTIIFGGVIIIWFLSYFPLSAPYGSEKSIIGIIGGKLSILLRPAGFGYWQAAVALLFGLLAKELVVGTLGTVFGGELALTRALSTLFTPLSAYAFMLMSLLYIPCLATIAVIKQEVGIRWAVIATGWSIFVGWLVATLFYQGFRLY
ncbi:MAG: ferrous iron transport protein B [Candidatus Omnitrophica bacterium]|nr:ferrous iron transport protein B [Candidatus Omnitrophota bacterium]